jgi:hypothetical protein
VAGLLLGAAHLAVSEHVGVPADQLVADAFDHPGEVEVTGLARHLGVVDHLEQQIAELLAQVVHVAAGDGVVDLVRLLDGVGGNRLEALLEIPGTAAIGIAQPRHDVEERRHIAVLGCGHRPDDRRPRGACNEPKRAEAPLRI